MVRSPVAVVVVALVVGLACGKKAETAAPPPAHDDGSGKPAAVVDAAAARPDAAPAPAADAEPPNYFQTLCPQLRTKIVECIKDPAFIAALDEGATAKAKKINKALRKEAAEWPDLTCTNLAPSYQYSGFLGGLEQLAAIPDLMSSCAKLGAGIKAAGGLFGGDQAW